MTRRLAQLLPAIVLLTALAVLAAFAYLSPGFAVRKLNLNDSGIWVTNDAEALFGRLNKSAETLDGLLGPAGGAQGGAAFSLDVTQDAAHVVARDVRSGRVTALDVANVAHAVDRTATIDPAFALDLRGGTVAVLDPASGKLWATRYTDADPIVDVTRLEAGQKPVADLGRAAPGSVEGRGAGLSVGVDGAVHAVSSNGRSVVVTPKDAGFAEPAYASGDRWTSVQVAAVGTQHAVLDAEAGVLVDPSGDRHDLGGDPRARLQSAGESAAAVVLATSTALLAVGDGRVTTLASGPDAAPAVPLVLRGCAFAAWAGEPGRAVRSCGGAPAEEQAGLAGAALVAPAFRSNHGQVVLNDTSDGKVFSFEEQRFVQNWTDAQPQEASDEGDPTKESRVDEDQPPKANDDLVGARPGRTTVAHVLDNDADQVGRILAVVGVSQPAGGATASIAPDGQTVLVTLPQDAADTALEYTISNGSATAKAKVTVKVRPESVNERPVLRPNAPDRTFAVASWGTIVLPAAGDWRDPDGDPVSLDSAAADGHKVGVTADGRITMTAGRAEETTMVTVAFGVSDGRGEPLPATARVKVLAHDATNGDAPLTEPDAVRGEVGKPIVVRPLGNDVPGADPLNPRATLELAARLAAVDGLEVETDVRSGEVLVTASEAKTYFLDYTAKFGAAKFSPGRIRVDAVEAGANRPTAAPDHVTVRGQASVMVDVLANDSDPQGSVLGVLSARPATEGADGAQLQVAVLQGRWVRIMPRAEALDPNPQVVHYTISNGLGEPVQGSITVTQLGAPLVDEAIVHDDVAVVRAGDSVLVGVLENDTSSSGEALVLDAQADGLPAGQLRVLDPSVPAGDDPGDVGAAYVSNDRVRYVAPASVAGPREIRIEYQASTAAGSPQTAVVNVTVNPAPSEERPNQAPQPQNLEARATSGQTVEIPIRPWGSDADGDTVTVLALASAPTKGRILRFTPNALVYQAYPDEANGGTDSFRYVVTDAFGATESGIVRVAITPPAEVQAPIAVADTVTAQPGREVALEALDNDMYAEADRPTIVPLADLGNAVPAGVRLDDERGPIIATTPAGDDPPVLFAYALQNSGGVGPAAQVAVRSQPGYLNAPRVFDHVAAPAGTNATADVLADAWDPDGPHSALRVTRLSTPDATASGGTVTVPLTDRAQVVTYEVTDGDGATAAAVLFVPAAGAGVPFVKPGSVIEVDANGQTTFDLSTYVESPRRTPVRVTVAESLTAAPAVLSLVADAPERLTVTASGDYVGPGAVTFEVIDGEAGDPAARTAVVSVPVQVGPETPVLRCPPSTQRLVQGGAPVRLRIAAICSVWTPDVADADTLDYSADWATGIGDVTASAAGGIVTVTAGSNAVPGQAGVLQIGVNGSRALKQDINVQVVAAPKPRLVVRDITDVKQGTSVSQAIQLSSPLRRPAPRVISIEQVGGMPAVAQAQGERFTITPGADSSGTMTFRVVASDVADAARTDRQVTATLTVTVYGIPDAPTPPQPAMQLRSKAASVTFTPGRDNGAPITAYEVRGGGRTVNCGRATRCDVTGLANGVPVSFEVRAQNKAGWSEWSAQGPSVTPDEVPGRVPSFAASSPADGSLTLTWSHAANEGSDVTQYVISYGGSTLQVAGSATSATVRGLDNNATYTFSIVARNDAGLSQQSASTQGQSSGRPRLTTTSVAASDLGATAQVTVSWAAADPQGPRPVTYAVTRSGGSAGGRTWTGLTGTTVADSIAYDGSTYTYAVTATNATGGADHTSAPVSKSFTATGKPAAWAAWTATPTGTTGQVRLSYTVPASRGSASTVTLLGAGSARTLASGSGTASTSFSGVDVGGLTNGQAYAMQLRVCNEAGACTTSATVSATPYGPLADPTLNVSKDGRTVTFSTSGSGNGRNARLTLAASGGATTSNSTTGAGSLSVGPQSVTVGYSTTVTVTATLADPAGGRATQTVTRSVTTEAEPPPPTPVKTVSVWKGGRTAGDGSCTYYGGGLCYYIGITTSGFAGESYQCTVSYPGYTWSSAERYTGNVRDQTDKWLGFNVTVTVNCGGTIGRAAW